MKLYLALTGAILLAVPILIGVTMTSEKPTTNNIGNVINNTGIVTQGQTGNNTINNYGPPNRLLTVPMAEKLITSLKMIGPRRIDVCGQMSGSDDIIQFAGQFAQAFHEAGWEVHGVNTVAGFAPVKGVAVLVRDKSNPLPAATQALKALRDSGVDAHLDDFDSGLPADRMVIYVGNR